MSNRRRPRSVKEALKQRKTRTSRYRIPLVEHAEVVRRMEELSLARNTLTAGEYLRSREGDRPDLDDAIAKARSEVEERQKAVDECFHDLVFKGIPEDDFDKLVNAFPPTDEQLNKAIAAGEELPVWDEDEFPLALLERCTLESELTMDDWRAELADWTRAEKQEIRARVLECNLRSYSSTLDFG